MQVTTLPAGKRDRIDAGQTSYRFPMISGADRVLVGFKSIFGFKLKA